MKKANPQSKCEYCGKPRWRHTAQEAREHLEILERSA